MSRSIRHLRTSALPLVTPRAVSIRTLHSTPFRLLATPQTGPQTLSQGPIATPNPAEASVRTGEHPGSHGAKIGGQQAGSGPVGTLAKAEYPDYSKGESALDKASQLFFFTEIVRGEFCLRSILGGSRIDGCHGQGNDERRSGDDAWE